MPERKAEKRSDFRKKYGNKRILIVGMGKSGMAAFEALAPTGASLTCYDDRDLEWDDPDAYKKIEKSGATICFNGAMPPANKYDYCVLSPGVSIRHAVALAAKKSGAVLIGDLELAYELSDGEFIGITGTNGKTTTTTLVGEIWRRAHRKSIVTGNIGKSVTETVSRSQPKTVFITEVSSFQLETIHTFRPHIAAILNLTPDHLDRHGTMAEYGRMKMRMIENQTEDDWFVFNADDKRLMQLVNARKRITPKLAKFSLTERVRTGAFLENGAIFLSFSGKARALINVGELLIPGRHNIENAMAAATIASCAGISDEDIVYALRNFHGVEHRMELACEIKGVRFVNDSKGTNPDASQKAIDAVNGGIILIAGGYDKQSDFTSFIRGFGGKVKHLVLLGETADQIEKTAHKEGFRKTHKVKDMSECVKLSYELADMGDTVLLSPASASWDMYDNFEERGAHFKSCVNKLKESGE